MGGEAESRVGLRARARKSFSSFMHSKGPVKEPGVEGIPANGGEALDASKRLGKGSRGAAEVDALKRGDAAADCSPQTRAAESGEGGPASPWPEEFVCPISKTLMADPVIISSGTSYERRNVKAYLDLGFRHCYKTEEPLEHLMMTKNSSLKASIDRSCDSRGVARPVAPDAYSARQLVELVCGRADDGAASASDTASSSDSTGSRASTGPRNLPRPQPRQIPETGPADVSVEERGVSGERILNEERQRHTWSGVKPQTFAVSDPSTSSAGAGADIEWSSAVSHKYGHSTSVFEHMSGLSLESRESGMPLPLTTTPLAFRKSVSRDGNAAAAAVRGGDLSDATVGELIEKLQHRQTLEQEQGTVEIRRLTRVSAENRVSLCGLDVLHVLLPLLQSRYSNVQINAVAAVMNLSLEKANKLKLARAGAIPFLIDVLKSGHVEAQEHAAGAIFSLALNDDNKMAIGVLGAIPPLIHVLRTGKPLARRDAAMALYHLSLSQMNRTKLIKAGGVAIFLGIARDERSDVVSRALLILGNIAAMQDGRVALAEMSAVQVMVGLLSKGDEAEAGAEAGSSAAQEGAAADAEESSRVNWAEVREQAAATLLLLSHHNFRFKSQAVQAGAMDGLQRLLKEGTPRAREKATALLGILRDAPDADGSADDSGLAYRRSYMKSSSADDRAESAQF